MNFVSGRRRGFNNFIWS